LVLIFTTIINNSLDLIRCISH